MWIPGHGSELAASCTALALNLLARRFGWHQGWNDGCSLNQTAEYETNLVNLIKDLRHEWGHPALPVSIAVSREPGARLSLRDSPNPNALNYTYDYSCHYARLN